MTKKTYKNYAIRLTEEEYKRLGELAITLGIRRSEVVRMLLERAEVHPALVTFSEKKTEEIKHETVSDHL